MQSIKKLNHAKKQIRKLESVIRDYINSKPYEIYQTEETNGDLTYRLRVLKELPQDWGLDIGDIIHNIRSSLDLLVSDFLINTGKNPTNKSAYPFYETEKEIVGDSANRMIGVSKASRNLIISTQPFKTGNQTLWKLHKLDIISKHRLIIPVGSSSRSIGVDMTGIFRRQGILPADFKPMPIFIKPADRQYPLKDGSGIFGVSKQGRESHDPTDHQFVFDISFGEGDVMDGEPIIETLDLFAQEVQNIFERAEKLLVYPQLVKK